VIAEIFNDQQLFSYDPMWRSIKEKFESHEIGIGDGTAKDFLTHYQSKGWIVKTVSKNYACGSIELA